MNSNQEN